MSSVIICLFPFLSLAQRRLLPSYKTPLVGSFCNIGGAVKTKEHFYLCASDLELELQVLCTKIVKLVYSNSLLLNWHNETDVKRESIGWKWNAFVCHCFFVSNLPIFTLGIIIKRRQSSVELENVVSWIEILCATNKKQLLLLLLVSKIGLVYD